VFGGFLTEDEIITDKDVFSERFVWKGGQNQYYSIYYPAQGGEASVGTIYGGNLELFNDRTLITIPTLGIGFEGEETRIKRVGSYCRIGRYGDIKVKKEELYFEDGEVLFSITYEEAGQKKFSMNIRSLKGGNITKNDIFVFDKIADSLEIISKGEAQEYWKSLESEE